MAARGPIWFVFFCDRRVCGVRKWCRDRFGRTFLSADDVAGYLFIGVILSLETLRASNIHEGSGAFDSRLS